MSSTHKTAKGRKTISAPLKILLNEIESIESKTILDYGSGKGVDLLHLKNCGKDAHGYDPYYLSVRPKIKFDLILCTYVLNVIRNEKERLAVVTDISSLLKGSGVAFISVRRDLEKDTKTQFKVFLDKETFFKCKNFEIYKIERKLND